MTARNAAIAWRCPLGDIGRRALARRSGLNVEAGYLPRDDGDPGTLPDRCKEVAGAWAQTGSGACRTFALGLLFMVGLLVASGCGLRGGHSDPTESSDAKRATSEIEEFAHSLDDPVAKPKRTRQRSSLRAIGAAVTRATGYGRAVSRCRLKDVMRERTWRWLVLSKTRRTYGNRSGRPRSARAARSDDDGKKYCAFPINLPVLTGYDNLHYTNILIQVDGLTARQVDAVSWYRPTRQPEPTPAFSQPNDGITSGEDLLNTPPVQGGYAGQIRPVPTACYEIRASAHRQMRACGFVLCHRPTPRR